MAINVFNTIGYLEPKCRSCDAKIDYGVTTHFDEDKECHVCNSCGCIVE